MSEHHRNTDATVSQSEQVPARRWGESRLAPTTFIRVCPECAGPVIRNSGCQHCAQCGWGKCG